MRKIILASILLVAGCANQTAPDNAAKVEQGLTLAVTLYTGYLRLPDCATTEGAAARPLCSDTEVIRQAAPKRQAAFDNVSTYVAAVNHDVYYCTGVSDLMMANCVEAASAAAPDTILAQLLTAANSALSLFNQIVATLPKKGA